MRKYIRAGRLPGIKLVSAAVASCFASQFALANPTGPIVVNGQVTFEDGTCTSSGATSFTAVDHAQFFLLAQETGLGYLGGSLAFLPEPPTLRVTTTCSSSSGTFTFTQDQPYFGTTWLDTGPEFLPVEPGAVYTDALWHVRHDRSAAHQWLLARFAEAAAPPSEAGDGA